MKRVKRGKLLDSERTDANILLTQAHRDRDTVGYHPGSGAMWSSVEQRGQRRRTQDKVLSVRDILICPWTHSQDRSCCRFKRKTSDVGGGHLAFTVQFGAFLLFQFVFQSFIENTDLVN